MGKCHSSATTQHSWAHCVLPAPGQCWPGQGRHPCRHHGGLPHHLHPVTNSLLLQVQLLVQRPQ
ncbi:hypothetical protein CHLRE_04g227301v5 [Chlamydomonas reinhardtii]|uniref:Uncharacterized protein n=1 Tax=Chlamydomonas reinhardtii TaxID=3055 RepID=A0A2K3DUQ4_CHLRE|nr:uncharacterized protein CHLRE_04g227301v5 [Chlamydomonas reinhardtii]PNW84263.1 hypothetical protein CHLRE_04g227301v5 [Chlamydomonas reinhardtii]